MSSKEKIIQLLDEIPDYRADYVLAYIQGIIASVEADKTFCQHIETDWIDIEKKVLEILLLPCNIVYRKRCYR